MSKEEIEKLVGLRTELISAFTRLRDYKNNKNAIMKEVDHARLLSNVISKIDEVLKDHVKFE